MDAVSATAAQTVDAARLVDAVRDATLALNSSITLRLFTGERGHDERIADQLRKVLGEDGPRLVGDFVNAKNALARALTERCALTRQGAQQQLQILLACGAVSVAGNWHTLNDIDGGQVKARVERIDSARLQADGSVWGFLHVSPQERCYENWEFTWRDGQLKVRTRD